MFKKGILYIVLNYSIQFMNIILNLLLMKYLNSYQLGSLALARVWQQLVDYSHLGTRFSLDRYLPTSDEVEKKYLVITVLISTIISSLIVCLAAIIINKADIVIAILTVSGVFIAFTNILKAYYRATNNINEMLKLVFYNQVLPLVISLLVYIFTHDFNSYLITLLMGYFLFFIFLLYKELELFKFFEWVKFKQTIKKILRPSLWLFINSIFVFAYLVMDRFFIDYSLGRDELGHYSIIIFAFTALMIIPATCAELLFVKVIRESCESGKVIFIKEVSILLGITTLGIIFTNLAMTYFVRNFTSYGFLVDQMHLVTWAVLPFALTSIYHHVMNGLDLRKLLTITNFSVFLLLLIYYVYPIISSQNFSLQYYLYAKLATGWLVFFGYIFILFYKKNILT